MIYLLEMVIFHSQRGSQIATKLQAAAIASQRAVAHPGHDLGHLVPRDALGEVLEELQADELILAPTWLVNHWET